MVFELLINYCNGESVICLMFFRKNMQKAV